MKLADIVKTISKKKDQQVKPIVEVSDVPIHHPKSGINHHKGVLHVMGIDPNSNEYEETSDDLEYLSRTNPALYRKITNGD